MLAYYILMGVPALLALFFLIIKKECKIKNSNKLVINSFFIIWLLILMFRSQEVGADLPVYRYHFEHYQLLNWNEIFTGILTGEFEATYVLISKLLSYITNNFQFVMIVCALVSIIPIWYFYQNESTHPYLSVVLFVNVAPFVMYFSGLRQAMAMAFIVPAYYYCKEKKLANYLFTILLAFLTHRSAFILLLLYPVYHLKIKNKKFLLLLIPILMVTYTYKMPIFMSLFSLMSSDFISEYSVGIGETGAYSVLLLLIVFLFYVFEIADIRKLDQETIGLRNILILCIVIQIFAGVHTTTMRLNYYYLLLVPIIIDKFIDVSKYKLKQIVNISILCIVCFFTFYFFYKGYTDVDILQVFPYKTVFEDYKY